MFQLGRYNCRGYHSKRFWVPLPIWRQSVSFFCPLCAGVDFLHVLWFPPTEMQIGSDGYLSCPLVWAWAWVAVHFGVWSAIGRWPAQDKSHLSPKVITSRYYNIEDKLFFIKYSSVPDDMVGVYLINRCGIVDSHIYLNINMKINLKWSVEILTLCSVWNRDQRNV